MSSKTNGPVAKRSKALLVILPLILFLPLLLIGIDLLRTQSLATRAKKLRIGDTKQQVEQQLGRPSDIFNPLPEARTNLILAIVTIRSETWAYGTLNFRTSFQSEFPWFNPVRFRFFGPDPEDVSIEFDSSNRVSRITIPSEK